MANCVKPYYCYTLEGYPTGSDCDTQDEYLSGWSAVGLLACGTTVTDPSDGEELQGLIDAGSLIIVNNIKGGLDEPSALTIDPTTSCGVTKTINYDRTFTWEDYKTSKEVVEWYNEMKANNYGGALLYGCDGTVTYINQELRMTAALSGENNNSVAKRIGAQLAWRDINDPVPYDAPAGIFG